MSPKQYKFYRHPSEIPVELSPILPTQDVLKKLPSDLNHAQWGGLCFICYQSWEIGSLTRIRLPLVKPSFEAIVHIAWCKKRLSYYEIGAAFLENKDAFHARMMEQLCQIETYRQTQKAQGRSLNEETAALEWISSNAEIFERRGKVLP